MDKDLAIVAGYQAIVAESFGQSFPGFKTLQPSDPARLFADALSQSLAKIEKRQNRVVDTLLDCLPTLFGFEARPARLPTGVFQFQPAFKQREIVQFSPQTVLRFRAEEQMVAARFLNAFELLPIKAFQVSLRGNGVLLQWQSEASLPRLVLRFMPQGTEANALLESAAPLLRDTTQGFTQAGELEFDMRGREGARLELQMARPLVGSLWINTAPLEIFFEAQDCELACLRGESWETCALPEGLVEIPPSIQMRLPNETRAEFTRAAPELLRQRHLAPDAFRKSFFYNPARHELVLPASEFAAGEFEGGMRLETKTAVFRPAQDWYEKLVLVNESPKLLSAAEPLQALTGFVPRETDTAFLDRFYRTMAVQARASGVFPHDLCRQIPSIEPLVRLAETQGTDTICFYLYFGGPGCFVTSADRQAALERVEHFLQSQLPLSQNFEVREFEQTPVRLLTAESVAIGALGLIEPYPFGEARVGVPLAKSAIAHAIGLVPESIDLIAGSSGRLVDGLERRTGECFVVQNICGEEVAHG